MVGRQAYLLVFGVCEGTSKEDQMLSHLMVPSFHPVTIFPSLVGFCMQYSLTPSSVFLYSLTSLSPS